MLFFGIGGLLAVGRLPSFLFIGAMKCATTTMSAQLAAQPGIFMVSNPKEIYFFSYDHYYERGVEWYQSHFDVAEPSDLCGEAATTYTQLPTYPKASERLHSHLPDAKLIYIIRHPIDRLISQYMHEYSLRKILVDINRAIDQHPELVAYSKYAMQLKPYISKFGYSQILPVFFERVSMEPQSELERICQYIGYEGTPQWDYEMRAKNVSKERVMKNPVLDFLRKSSTMAPIRSYLIPKGVREQLRRLVSIKIERPEISSQQIAYLKSVFDEDLAELGQWMGVELTCDTFKSVVKATPGDWSRSITSSPL